MGLTSQKSKVKNPEQNNHNDRDSSSLSTFLEEVQNIRLLIGNLQKDVETVDHLQNTILSSPLANREKQQLDTLVTSIRKTALSVINVKLQNLGKFVLEGNGEGPSVDVRISRNQHNALVEAFKSLVEKYHKGQADYRDKCKIKLQRQLEIAGMDHVTDEKLNEMMDNGNFHVFTQSIIQETEQAQRILTEVTSRHHEIIQLEASIQELHDLTLDFALLVETQGDTITQIVKNVEDTKIQVEVGETVLKKTKKQKKLNRKRKLYIALITVIVVAGVVTLIVVL